MSAPAVRLLVAVIASVACIEVTAAQAQSEPTWRLHAALEGDRRLSLCKDRDSVNLLVAILARAFDARAGNDGEKAGRLMEIAARLQGEICTRPAADDIVILRCKLGQRDIAGTTVSTVKLSAVVRADASKGEQPFFAWTYATIDESGGSAADAQSANSRWCAGDAGADEPLSPAPDLVLRVQQRLYDFGLRIAQFNGQLTADTVQGLMAFQKWANLPPTGQLTKQTVQKISTTPAPAAWVSFAFDGSGNFGAETGATRRGAEIEAVKRLQRRSRGDYKLSSVPSPNCIAFAITRYSERGRRRTTFTQAFTSAGGSIADASQSVLAFCDREKGGGSCEIRHALCADGTDGQPSRFDKESIPANAPAPRFDPGSLPLNSQAPDLRFDPKVPAANMPAPR